MSHVEAFEKELAQRAKGKYATWHKVDLHNHSPSSFDYAGHKPTAAADTAAQIKSAGLSIVMFTDHGKLPNPDFLKEVASKTGALVLAGIELNIFANAFSKPKDKIGRDAFFHLLVGFDPSGEFPPSYWENKVYETCGRESRKSGSETIVGIPAELNAVIECLSAANAILIPAHLHSGGDAFRSRSFDDVYNDELFLKHVPKFTALEVTDKNTAEYFDGEHTETKHIRIGCIQSSDAHKAEDIGWRPTWVQMQRPTFQELAASLKMRQRISLVEPSIPDSYVSGMHIDGVFLKDFWLPFSPHSNMFIGVKGSGKTAALECLRFVLGVEVPQNSRDQVKAHLGHILGSVGRVQCLVRRKDGTMVLVERSMTNPDQFQISFRDGRTETVGQIQALGFPAQILGWHEIEHAATDGGVRRKYMDAIAGPEAVAKLENSAKTVAEQIKYSHEQAASRYQSFKSFHEQVLAQEELRKGLQELSDANLIELKNKFESAIAHREEMRRLGAAIAQMGQTHQQKISELLPFAAPILPGNSPLDEQVKKFRFLMDSLLEMAKNFGGQILGRATEVSTDISAILAGADATYAAFARDYENAVNSLAPEKRALLESHRQVLEQTKELPALQRQRDQAKQDVEGLLVHLMDLCSKVSECLALRTKLRRESVEEFGKGLSKSGVKLELLGMQNTDSYAQFSNQYRNGFSVVEAIKNEYPSALTLHDRLKAAYQALLKNLVNGNRVFFSQPEFSYYLTVFENDDLAISFDPFIGGGSGFRPLDQLSAGQRCTAMFPLLLRLRQGPLVIDQPEDNLDNRHIAEKVSPVIAKDKETRQIVMTSHNANLLVLSDPESVVVFESNGLIGEAIEQGFLGTRSSPVTKHVLEILDGGERALELRYAKYGKK